MSPKNKIEVKYLSPHELSEIGEQLLRRYNPANTFPVPIEEITELELGISILPVPNLRKDKAIDAYISHDFQHIIIDDDCYKRFITRTRFSIAHEVAHFLLHKSLYQSQGITTEEEYINFSRSIPTQTVNRIEWQSYSLAGFILVPRAEFKILVDRAINVAGGSEKLSFLDLSNLVDDLKSHFNVSGEVIQRRFKADYPEIFESFFNL